MEQERENRLDGVLLEPGPQVRQEQPHCSKELLDAHLCHQERSERDATGPHRSGVGWDDIPHISFCKKKSTGSGKAIKSVRRSVTAPAFPMGLALG